jgi:hypothetical protein
MLVQRVFVYKKSIALQAKRLSHFVTHTFTKVEAIFRVTSVQWTCVQMLEERYMGNKGTIAP